MSGNYGGKPFNRDNNNHGNHGNNNSGPRAWANDYRRGGQSNGPNKPHFDKKGNGKAGGKGGGKGKNNGGGKGKWDKENDQSTSNKAA